MTCKELHDRILEEFLEPDTGILNILPEKAVRELLDTPEDPAPEWLLRACRENAVTDDFEERDSYVADKRSDEKAMARCAEPTQQKPVSTETEVHNRLTLKEMLRWATAEAARRNRGQ